MSPQSWPLPLDRVQVIVEHLLTDGSRDGLILGDELNVAMGASARRRAERKDAVTEDTALTIATVLDGHAEEYDSDCSEHYGCGCGWMGPDWSPGGQDMLAPNKTREQWRAHLVQVLTDALA